MLENNPRLRKVLIGSATFILWLVTAAVGLWQILIVRDIVLRLYARLFVGEDTGAFGPLYWSGVALSWVVVVIMSVVWMAIVIGGGEYHYKRVGQSSSWRLFAWTIGVQMAIFVLALLI